MTRPPSPTCRHSAGRVVGLELAAVTRRALSKSACSGSACRPARLGRRSESAWPLLTKEPGGGARCANPRLSHGRGTGSYIWARSGAATKSSGQNVKPRAKSACDRITAPSMAYLGSDPQLGEVRGAVTPRSLVSGRMGGGPRRPHGRAISPGSIIGPTLRQALNVRIWSGSGPGPGPDPLSRSGHDVKGTHPGVTAAPWQAAARGPERPHATRQVANHKTTRL